MLSFAYSMYDAMWFGDKSMGSMSFQGSNDGCSTWTTLWSKSGNLGDAWHTATLTATHAPDYTCVRFLGVTGNGYQSDMALDGECVRAY